MKPIILTFIIFLLPIASYATEQSTSVTTITEFYSFTEFDQGDVLVKVASPAINCSDGFWLSGTDPGLKSTLSILLAAFHTNAHVQIFGLDTERWPGSPTGQYCKLTTVIEQK